MEEKINQTKTFEGGVNHLQPSAPSGFSLSRVQIRKNPQKELTRFLKWVDRAIKATEKVKLMDVGVELFFNAEERFFIPESLKDFVELEIGKRDLGVSTIEWHEGYLSYVIIRNPHRWGGN